MQYLNFATASRITRKTDSIGIAVPDEFAQVPTICNVVQCAHYPHCMALGLGSALTSGTMFRASNILMFPGFLNIDTIAEINQNLFCIYSLLH